MARRRRNPSLADVNSLLMLGLAGGAAYVLYKLVSGGTQAVSTAAAAVSKAIVPNPTGTASIVLSDGSEVPYESVNWHKWVGWWNSLPQFDYNGVDYQLMSNTPDETNTYYAAPHPAAGWLSLSG